MIHEKNAILYWNVNVPEEQWTDTPSEALANVDESTREQLGTKDEDYPIMSWEDVQNVIRELSLIHHMVTKLILFVRGKQIGSLQKEANRFTTLSRAYRSYEKTEWICHELRLGRTTTLVRPYT